MNFIMPRDRTVTTLLGRSFEFKKGEPTYVPQMCWDAVIAVGGVPEDELPVEDDKGPIVPQGAERSAVLIEAIRKMVLKGERADFTASGAPQTSVLSTNVGFSVDAKERDAAWLAASNDEK